MEKTVAEMITEAVEAYEKSKLEMLQAEAEIMSAKNDWFSQGVATTAAHRVDMDARFLEAKVENQKQKIKLATMKAEAKKLKSETFTKMLTNFLVANGHQSVVDEAQTESRRKLEETGFLKAYEL